MGWCCGIVSKGATCHTDVSDGYLFQTRLLHLADVLEKAEEDGPGTGIPVTYVRDPEEAPGT